MRSMMGDSQRLLSVVFVFLFGIPGYLAIQDRLSRQQVAPVLVRAWKDGLHNDVDAQEIDALGMAREISLPSRNQTEKLVQNNLGKIIKNKKKQRTQLYTSQQVWRDISMDNTTSHQEAPAIDWTETSNPKVNFAATLGEAIADNTAVEVFHFFNQDPNEPCYKARWLYHTPGSRLWFNVGRTMVVNTHDEVNSQFGLSCSSTADCFLDCQNYHGYSLANQASYRQKFNTTECAFVCPASIKAARQAGFDSIQILAHRMDMHAPEPKFEILDLSLPYEEFPIENSLMKHYYSDEEASMPCRAHTITKAKSWLSCAVSHGVLINMLSIPADRTADIGIDTIPQNVIKVVICSLGSIGVAVLWQHQKVNSVPLVMATLSSICFSFDNFLIAFSGKYLHHMPSAHMAVMFIMMASTVLVYMFSPAYRSALCESTISRESRTSLCFVFLTGGLVASAQLCSNKGFSMDLSESGPHQALSCGNVLIVAPFFYAVYGETLTKMQLLGCAFIMIGCVAMSDVLHWGGGNMPPMRAFLWLCLATVLYAASDITLRFASTSRLPRQVRVMLMIQVMGVVGAVLFMAIHERGAFMIFMPYHESPTLLIWPLLNAVAGSLGMISVSSAFEAPGAPTGVLSAIVNVNSVVLVLLNWALLGYFPSQCKSIGMCFIIAGVIVFNAF